MISHVFKNLQWNSDFSNLQGKRKLVRKIGEFEKSGIKLQCSTEEGKQLMVRVIGRFEKMRKIPLYFVQVQLSAVQGIDRQIAKAYRDGIEIVTKQARDHFDSKRNLR